MQHRRKDLSRKCHSTVARGPVPRERPVDHSMARDRPSPYAERGCSSTQAPARSRSVGAYPPRVSGSPQHGEGQALALRGRGGVFRQRTPPGTVARGPVPRDRWSARTMARDRFSHRPTMKGLSIALLHRDQEVSPTGTSLASRPGGLSYRGNGIAQGITKPF